MVEIVLVRHATTDWSGARYSGVSDPPLSAAGRLEADRLAEMLARTIEPDTRVVSSPLRRALATAGPIAAALGTGRVDIDARWREADFGIAEGRTFDELTVLAPEVATAIVGGAGGVDWPGGETHASLADRVATAWRTLVDGARGIVVVTHAGPLMHARALAEGRPIRATDLVPPAAAIRFQVMPEGLFSVSVLPSRP